MDSFPPNTRKSNQQNSLTLFTATFTKIINTFTKVKYAYLITLSIDMICWVQIINLTVDTVTDIITVHWKQSGLDTCGVEAAGRTLLLLTTPTTCGWRPAPDWLPGAPPPLSWFYRTTAWASCCPPGLWTLPSPPSLSASRTWTETQTTNSHSCFVEVRI